MAEKCQPLLREAGEMEFKIFKQWRGGRRVDVVLVRAKIKGRQRACAFALENKFFYDLRRQIYACE